MSQERARPESEAPEAPEATGASMEPGELLRVAPGEDVPREGKEARESVTILFCGDSGDGMQLTGSRFTNTAAVLGNDVCTLPDYPSEIRAPAGSLAGVSAFQVRFASQEIFTPGDRPDALVAMNPAALRVHLPRLVPGGVLIVNEDAFTKGGLQKAGYEANPLEDEELEARYQVQRVPITTLTKNALEPIDLDGKSKARCKNLLALGLLYWLYDRPLETTLDWIERKFARLPAVAEANRLALLAGWSFGDTMESFVSRYRVPPCVAQPGTYRLISGNEATALGLVTAAHLAGKELVYASYPITPATDVLHHLARLKAHDVTTLQMEDEIAAMGATIGAAFGGAFAVTGTSGPGLCLKSEALNLAIMLELPLVVLDVQRGGPSTGLPTKTEQTDLLQALAGRNGESPIPILAAASPADAFEVAVEAFRIAVRHTTPVMMLTETYIANGAEPWAIPDLEDLAPIPVVHPDGRRPVEPYGRDERTLARPWILPGTPGLAHRVGGLEKRDPTGEVCGDPENHARMCALRREKVWRVAQELPPLEVEGPESGELLVLSWGGRFGEVRSAVRAARGRGHAVAHAHLRLVHPFPRGTGEVLARYRKVLVPELNLGQLATLLRAEFLVDAIPFGLVEGRPFRSDEVLARIEEVLR